MWRPGLPAGEVRVRGSGGGRGMAKADTSGVPGPACPSSWDGVVAGAQPGGSSLGGCQGWACHRQMKCRESLSPSRKRSCTQGTNLRESPGPVPESGRIRNNCCSSRDQLEASGVFLAEVARMESPQQGRWGLPASGRPCSQEGRGRVPGHLAGGYRLCASRRPLTLSGLSGSLGHLVHKNRLRSDLRFFFFHAKFYQQRSRI